MNESYTAGYRLSVLALIASLIGVGLGVGYMYSEARKEISMDDIVTRVISVDDVHEGAYFDWDDMSDPDNPVPQAAVKLLKEFSPTSTYRNKTDKKLLEVDGVAEFEGVWYIICTDIEDTMLFMEPAMLELYKGN